MAQRSLSFALYAATLDGYSAEALARDLGWSEDQIRERISAVRLALTHQVQLDLNPHSPAFRQGAAKRAA